MAEIFVALANLLAYSYSDHQMRLRHEEFANAGDASSWCTVGWCRRTIHVQEILPEEVIIGLRRALSTKTRDGSGETG